jgi:hypothetical protein
MTTFQNLPFDIREMIHERAMRVSRQSGRVIKGHGRGDRTIEPRFPFRIPAVCFLNNIIIDTRFVRIFCSIDDAAGQLYVRQDDV